MLAVFSRKLPVFFVKEKEYLMRSCFVLSAVLFLAGSAQAGDDALAEVNAARAARGLPAFQRDDGLTQAAMAAADYRAARLIEGHANDFAFLPSGSGADAAGCAAWPQGMGFRSCCLYENWAYAGAATTKGRDGKLYHHLFVRSGSPVGSASVVSVRVNVASSCQATQVQVSIGQGYRRLFGGRRGRCR